MATVCGATAAVLVATSASAAVFTGWDSNAYYNSAGNEVWQLFATFDTPGLVFLNCFYYEDHGGAAMGAMHYDMFTDPDTGAFGTWSPAGTMNAHNPFDSYVTAHGTFGSPTSGGTVLGPSFDNTQSDHLGLHADWYDVSPNLANVVSGTSYKVAQFVRAPGAGAHNGYLKVSFKVAGTSIILFGEGEFTIGMPAPGALALLAFSPLLSGRRRG